MAMLVLSVGCQKETVEPSEKIYAVLINQSGENAPVPTILENTVGNIQWEYVSMGVYHGKLTGAFPLDQTIITSNNGVSGYTTWEVRHFNSDYIELRTYSGINPFTNAPNLSNGVGGVSFELKVYQ